jgi:hypothetical protein
MWRTYSNPDPHGAKLLEIQYAYYYTKALTKLKYPTCTYRIPVRVLSFLKNIEVQQPTIRENQNPLHMHIFNINTNILLNKKVYT